MVNMHGDAQIDSDVDLVRGLLQDQFPRWANLPIARIESDGTDNAIYRVGDELVARLPLVEWAAEQALKECIWLPQVAPLLPLAVPTPVASGEPGRGYPVRWSVHGWIDGVNASPERIDDISRAVDDMARFITALHEIDLPDPPVCPRATPLADSDELTRWGISELREEFDAETLTTIWDEALAAPPWPGPPVWVHADLTDGNILVRDGRIVAVIDWSFLGRAEPANDLDVAWDLFSGPSRQAFRELLEIDDATWARARGWAVKSVIGVLYYRETNPGIVARCRRRLASVIDDHRSLGAR